MTFGTKKLVIVDDNSGVRIAIKQLLPWLLKRNKIDLKIYTSENGVEGLGLIYTLDPDAVIVDLTLPKYDGKEIVDFLLNHQQYRKLGKNLVILAHDDSVDNLSREFTVLKKTQPDFSRDFAKKLTSLFHAPNKRSYSLKEKFTLSVANSTLNAAAKVELAKTHSVKTPLSFRQKWKLRFSEMWLSVMQVVLFLTTRQHDDSNPEQKKMDLLFFRRNYYPTFLASFTTLATVLLLLINILLPQFLFIRGLFSASWYGSGWGYRTQVTISETMIPGSTNLSNFPVLINLTDSRFKTVSQGGKVQLSSGDDILFTDSSGDIKLDYEVESYNGSTGNIMAWVKIPSLNATSNTNIYVYYGNAAATNQENPSGVWSNGYIGVWHLDNNPVGTAPQMKDSTSYGHDGTTVNMVSGNSVVAKIGNGINFDGTNDAINIYSSALNSNFDGNLGTLSAWAQISDSGTWADTSNRTLFQLGADTSNRVYFRKTGTNQILMSRQGGGTTQSYTSPTSTTGWMNLTSTWDDVGNNVNYYTDGSLARNVATATTYVGNIASDRAVIGAQTPAGTEVWKGLLDEVRLSNVVRSADWIATEFNTQNSPASYLTLGIEEANDVDPTPEVPWYDNDWSYRTEITINETMVPGAVSLSNFPLLVNITDNRLRTLAQGGKVALSSANDILFTNSNGTTKLDHEIESYNSTTGALVAWVKIPSLSATANTNIYIYYGNASATNQQNPTGVWSNDYTGVWHLNNNPAGSAPQMLDSTSNDQDGTAVNMVAGNSVSGKIGNAISFDGTNDAIDVYSSTLNSNFDGNSGSISTWAQIPISGDLFDSTQRTLIQIGADTSNRILMRKNSASTLFLQRAGGGTTQSHTYSVSSTNWFHVAFTWDTSNFYVYIDGALAHTFASPPTYTGDLASNRAVFGAQTPAGTDVWKGLLDEIRLSNAPRSADWITTEYNNQNGSYLSLAAEENNGTTPASTCANPTTISKVRYGEVFGRSDGEDTLEITYGNSIETYRHHLLVKRPDGSRQQEIKLSPNTGSGSTNVNLTSAGDYQFPITLGMREMRFNSTGCLVLQTNKRRATFRNISSSHNDTKLYFYVPAGTTSFTFYSQLVKGTSSVNNQSRLYKPNGSTYTTVDLAVDTMNWQSVNVNVGSGEDGAYWAASIMGAGASAGGGTTNAEGTYWVEGVPNFFTADPNSYFVPEFNSANVNVTVNNGTVITDRALMGVSRAGEQGSLSSTEISVFNNLGSEVNELPINYKLREPVNDNNDPNNLNYAAFSFSNQSIENAINTLNATPLILFTSIPDWYEGPTLNNGSCPVAGGGDKDGCLANSALHAEFAEGVVAALRRYNIDRGFNIKYMRILDEPNKDNLTHLQYAALITTVVNKIASYPDSRVSNTKVWAGSFSELKEDELDGISTFLDNIPNNSIAGISVHPWMMSYIGHGDIYSTRIIHDSINEIASAMDAKTAAGKKLIIPEFNGRYGDGTTQDKTFLDSFDQALWYASAMINAQRTGRVEALSYYPFLENGTVHNYRGVATSGGTIKPVGYAIKHTISKVEDKIISSSVSNSEEVDILATKDPTSDAMNYLLVNKADRTQNVSIATTLANGPFDNTANVVVQRMTSSNYATLQSVSDTTVPFSGSSLPLNITMAPNSIYTVSVSGYTDDSTPAVCGNNVLESGEVCDDGNTSNNDQCSASCNNACTAPQFWNGSACVNATCGNSTVEPGEVCDDGNTANNDQCSASCNNACTAPAYWNGSSCITPVCGNGVVQPGEACDDGNTSNNDQCSSTCSNECTAPAYWNGSSCITPVCGNGQVQPGEVCDDGNTDDDDQCSANCLNICVAPQTWDGSQCVGAPICGNNVVEAGETCDDGNTDDDDQCSASCDNACVAPEYWNGSSCTAPVCGNGIQQPGEVCDDGNTDDDDQCSASCSNACTSPAYWNGTTCVTPVCGNGVTQPGEACDDGNDLDGDQCSASCTNECVGSQYWNGSACVSPVCGNGVEEFGEACDDSNTQNDDQCSSTCNNSCTSPAYWNGSSCITPVCGNNIVQPGEACDDGNTNDNDQCSATCSNECTDPQVWDGSSCVTPAVCGNNELESGEVCDDGNTSNNDQCSSTCQNVCISPQYWNGASCVSPAVCGNGTLELDEACDDGNTSNNDQCSASCTNSCVAPAYWDGASCITPVCGNGVLQPSEACDDGNTDNNDQCSSTCQNICIAPQYWNGTSCVSPVCGNGIVQPGEVCDDGNTVNNDQCSASCTNSCVAPAYWNGSSCITPVCGNNQVEPGEACDDGNTVNNDQCSATCSNQCTAPSYWNGSSCITPVCGNGQVQPGEVCDDGNNVNNDQCSASCSNSCVAPEYWNGSACVAPTCGNGQVQPGEVCDDGNLEDNDQCSSTCTNICTSPQYWNGITCVTPDTCGNGTLDPGELCDDANTSNNDQCSASCNNVCVAPAYWNGSSCITPVCGNGQVQPGEVCDDGNTVNGDQCSSTCNNSCTSPDTWNGNTCVGNVTTEVPVCGNNKVEVEESCDDGNTANNDQCAADCRNTCDFPQVWDGSACVDPDGGSIPPATPGATPPSSGGTPPASEGGNDTPVVNQTGGNVAVQNRDNFQRSLLVVPFGFLILLVVGMSLYIFKLTRIGEE